LRAHAAGNSTFKESVPTGRRRRHVFLESVVTPRSADGSINGRGVGGGEDALQPEQQNGSMTDAD